MQRSLSVIGAAAVAGLLAWWVSSWPNPHADFRMLWTAMHNGSLYDQDALRAALSWGPDYPSAFIYPPSALPILALFSALPFRPALIAWATVSGAALGLASRTRLAPLLILTPPALWALPSGQTSVLLGATLFGAFQLLDRPRWAGLLFGLAIAFKPQLALVAMLALLVQRRWDVLFPAGITFVAMILISAAMYGPLQWIEWFRSLPAFLALHEAHPLLRRNEIALGLPVWIRALAIIAGALLAARALRQGDLLAAFVIAVGSALIGAAHAMGYEFAMLAPAYVALTRRTGPTGWAAALFILTPALIWIFPGSLNFAPRLLVVLALVFAIAVTPRGRIPLAQAPAQPG